MPGLNDLNSVLVEGILASDPVLEEGKTTFFISSHRYSHVGEEVEHRIFLFRIVTLGRLAEVCGEYLKKGKGVRAVGQLTTVGDALDEVGNSLIVPEIAAEHVEFKPMIREAKKE